MMLLRGPSSCNVARDHFQILTQCRFSVASNSLPIRRRNAVVSCTSSSSNRAPTIAVETGQPNGREVVFEKSLANRLRLGRLTEDSLSYKEKFIVRCYEVGINKTATVETIANLL